MAVQRRFREVMMFAAGVAAAGLLAAVLLWTPGVEAGSCQMQTLAPQTKSAPWGHEGFGIRYKIPDCFVTEGYKVMTVSVYNGQNIMVWYHK